MSNEENNSQSQNLEKENRKLHENSHPTFENSGTGVLGSIVFIALMLIIMALISIYMK